MSPRVGAQIGGWGRRGWRSRLIAATAFAAAPLLATGIVIGLDATPALAAATGGQGATLPYTELQAENAATNGTIIGPSASGVSYGTLADEASYRKAVTLSGQGKYVEFTTTGATNSIDFRYSIPDGSGGAVYTAPLSLYINGSKQADFTLTDAYSWYYGSYPFTNSPGSNPHHFYDEVHRLFGTSYPAGTKFRLQIDAEDTAASYTIDFADFEQVGAALSQPAGSVSVTSEGADESGERLDVRLQRRDKRCRLRRHGLDPTGHLQHPRPHRREQRDDRWCRHVVLDGHRHRAGLLRQLGTEPEHQRAPAELRHLRQRPGAL